MGLLDALSQLTQPMSPHRSVPHVLWRIRPQGDVQLIDMRCDICGETLHWRCSQPQRAAWRVNTWAGWHRHGNR
jgi:hypothetical protein